MMLVTEPERFDVLVTENVFGDIISEIAADRRWAGRSTLGRRKPERPRIPTEPRYCATSRGKGVANPVATILSAAMLLDWLADKHGDERCAKVPSPPSAPRPRPCSPLRSEDP